MRVWRWRSTRSTSTSTKPRGCRSRRGVTSHRDGQWPHVPDLVGVLGDRTVRRELAAASGVQDGHLRPRVLVLPRGAYLLLRGYVGREVGTHQEGVVVAQ